MGDYLVEGLREFFGHDTFRAQQREAIAHVAQGRDALVLMPTGGGKSLCYQLPALMGLTGDGPALVVSPLIALMHDQVEALRRRGARAALLNSTLTPLEEERVKSELRQGMLQLLYAAPERVASPRFQSLLRDCPPSLIAIDEAHCISQWGHEFRPDYLILGDLTTRFADTPVVALTATATPQVADDIVNRLQRPQARVFRTTFDRPNLTYRVLPKRESRLQLKRIVLADPSAPTIVYSLSRQGAEDAAAWLEEAGVAADFYHAGLGDAARRRVQDQFLRGDLAVICATVAFGMGIDKADVRRVIHLDMPQSIEAYYQETGRAGRDGAQSECVMFYTKGVWHSRRRFIEEIADPQERADAEQRLKRMMSFAEMRGCRRVALLRYFGEDAADMEQNGCGGCDNCLAGARPLAMAAAGADRSQRRRRSEPDEEERPLSEAETAALERLRTVRNRLAGAQGLPAYTVANNRELTALVQARPTTLTELGDVKGFGPKRIENYGTTLLETLHDALGIEASPSSEPAAAIELAPPNGRQPEPPPPTATPSLQGRALDMFGAGPRSPSRDPQSPTPELDPAKLPERSEPWFEAELSSREVTVALYRAGHTIMAIAERRMLSPGTVVSHLGTALAEGEEIDIGDELPAPRWVRAVRARADESVAAIYDGLDGRLSQYEIRLALAWLRGRGEIEA